MAKKGKRNGKGQFVKGGGAKSNPAKRRRARRRKAAHGTALAAPRANPPAKRRRAPRARRNPPLEVIKATVAPGSAALLGGIVCAAGSAVFGRLVGDGDAATVARVGLPILVGIVATQAAHPHAQAFAAGCFGVAGIGVAGVIADAVANRNPPDEWGDVAFENPPAGLLANGPMGLAHADPFAAMAAAGY